MSSRTQRLALARGFTRAGVGAATALMCLAPGVAVAETPSPAPSTTTTYKTDPSGFALTVSPTRLVVGPGRVGSTQQVMVVNRGSTAVHVVVQKRNFTAGPDGSLTYRRDAPFAAADWVTVSPTSFEAKPGMTQVVSATIKMPARPEPGDHQTALIFLVPAGKTAGNVKINRGVGTPMYVTVPGPVDESATLSRLTAPTFVAKGPVELTAHVENTGTVHRDFRGPTALTVSGTGSAKPFPDFTVPRGAVRDVTTSWNPPLLCVCHLTVQFANAAGPQSQTVRVIVFPWHLLAAAVGAVLIVLLFVRLSRRRYRASVAAAAARLQAASGSGGDG